MAMSLNSVQLIGNLTRDPELRYTPNGKAVCTVGLATNRTWTTEAGEKKEETEFHRIVVWGKLAEICSQLLTKGAKAFFQGRISTRNWTAQDGTQKTTVEIIAENMIVLSPKKGMPAEGDTASHPASHRQNQNTQSATPSASVSQSTAEGAVQNTQPEEKEETVSPDDIPF